MNVTNAPPTSDLSLRAKAASTIINRTIKNIDNFCFLIPQKKYELWQIACLTGVSVCGRISCERVLPLKTLSLLFVFNGLIVIHTSYLRAHEITSSACGMEITDGSDECAGHNDGRC